MSDQILELLGAIRTDIAATKAEHDQRFSTLDRSIAVLQQDVTKIRNKQFAQEVILDDIQNQARAIARAMDDLRQPAVKPVGTGGIAEIRQLNSELNALQRKHAELQVRIEILEGRREP
jgi:chromosome segregation ATPase